MDAKTLTESLIGVPSFVDENQDEQQLADFICDYFKKKLPDFKIYQQKVEGQRYNVIAYNSDQPKLVFSSHMDTVLATGKLAERLKPETKDGKLYGLGAVDMKAGLACSIAAAEVQKDALPPMALLFTCGEEYYFEGIRKFIQEFETGKTPFKKGSIPELVVFPEPTDLKISNGCRGCVELEFTVKGKSAHAGKPKSGINAIEQATKLVEILKNCLLIDNDKDLGFTTVNLAGLTGGIELDGKIGIRANAIADTARIVLDIRTATKEQTAGFILAQVEAIAKALQVGITNQVVKLDLQPFLLPRTNLNVLEVAIAEAGLQPDYREDLTNSGIGEFSLLGADLGWNAINFGPAPGNMGHKIDEYVELSSIDTVTNVFINLIKLFKKKS